MDERDPRIRSFLRQAGAIIASHQGLSSDAQSQLQQLANHLQLSSEQYEWAILQVEMVRQSTGELTRYEQAFLTYLTRKLERLAQPILPLKTENKALDAALRKFQISAVRAQHLIDLACQRTGVKSISKSDAETFVEEVICQQVGKATSLSDVQRDRLLELARQWGIDGEHTQRLLLQTLHNNLVAVRRSRRTGWTYAVGLMSVAIAALLGTRWAAEFRGRRAEIPPVPEKVLSVGDRKWPPWWPTPWLNVNLVRIHDIPRLPAILNQLESATADLRSGLYEQVAGLIENSNPGQRELLIEFLNEMLNSDPERELTGTWLSSFAASLNGTKPPLPLSDVELAKQLDRWSQIALICTLLDSSELPSGPDQRFVRILFETAGVDRSIRSSLELERCLQTSWLLNLWTQIIKADAKLASQAAPILPALASASLERMDVTVYEPILRQAVHRTLETAPESWHYFSDLIKRAISVGGRGDFEYWIRMRQQSGNADFQHFLGKSIIEFATGQAGEFSRAEVQREIGDLKARLINERFSGILDLDLLLSDSESALLTRSNSENPIQPPTIAQLAAAVNLAFQSVRQLEGQPKPVRELIGPAQAGDAFRKYHHEIRPELAADKLATASDFRTVQQTVDLLANLNLSNGEFRKSGLAKMAEVAPRITDLPPDQAVALATYYLSDQSISEQLNAEKFLPDFRHWPTLGLAIFDQLETANCSLDQAITVTQIFVGKQLELENDLAWRSQLRNQLLESIVETLRKTHLEDDPAGTAWKRLPTVLQELYRERNALLEINSIQSAQCRELAAELVLGSRNANLDRAQLENWLQRPGTGDLAGTVACLNLFVSEYLRETQSRFPEISAEVKAVNLAFSNEMQSAPTLGDQLAIVERSLLKCLGIRRRELIRRLLENAP